MGAKTKRVIVNAFLDLLNEKDFEKISITDITERCNSSRQTFYYHFDNIDNMLEWAFEEQTKAAIAALDKSLSWREAIEPYTDFLNRYYMLFKSAIPSSSCITILDLLKKSFYKFYYTFLTEYTNLALVKNDDFFINCCASAMLNYVIDEVRKSDHDFSRMNDELYVLIKKYGFGK